MEEGGLSMKKRTFERFSHGIAACAVAASLAAFCLPLSAFAAGSANLSLRHYTAGSGMTGQGNATVHVFLSSAPGNYALEHGGTKQELRFATLSNAVRAQYGVEGKYLSYATVNLQGNEAAKISGLEEGASYYVKEETANLATAYAREPYYFGNQGTVSGRSETEAVSVDHRIGETPVVIRKTWQDGNRVSYRPSKIKIRIDALDAEKNVIQGKSRIATIEPNTDGQWYFIEGLNQLELATSNNAARASVSNAQLASASNAGSGAQAVHYYRLSEIESGSNYVLNFPAALRTREVGQDLNFDIANSYYSSSSGGGGGRSYTGSGRAYGKSAAQWNASTNQTAPNSTATVDGTGNLIAPSTTALRNVGNRFAGQQAALKGRRGRMPKTGQQASAAAAVFCVIGIGALLFIRRREEI